tara:strand:+ start:427 stop:783 length:357 start_codon:yes stop_codon:yes gene_type:complete
MQHAGNAVVHAAKQPKPQLQQQSSHGIEQQGLVFSIHAVGVQHCNKTMLQIVHGAGINAMSLPPTETTKTSFSVMLCLINLSCLSNVQQALPLSVVASTDVLIATKGMFRSSARLFNQ